MAQVPVSQTVEEVRTEGKSAGPITHNQMYVGMVAIILVFVAGAFGLVIPAEVATAVATFVLIGVAWFTKGRKTCVETRVEVPTPTATPTTIADGTGAHRASQTPSTTTL